MDWRVPFFRITPRRDPLLCPTTPIPRFLLGPPVSLGCPIPGWPDAPDPERLLGWPPLPTPLPPASRPAASLALLSALSGLPPPSSPSTHLLVPQDHPCLPLLSTSSTRAPGESASMPAFPSPPPSQKHTGEHPALGVIAGSQLSFRGRTQRPLFWVLFALHTCEHFIKPAACLESGRQL